ncbi:hypothetical protein BDW62DRAFT_183416 [Aspergillus aurantiobrunneus]
MGRVSRWDQHSHTSLSQADFKLPYLLAAGYLITDQWEAELRPRFDSLVGSGRKSGESI